MRSLLVAPLMVAAFAGPAAAETVLGTYEVKYEVASNNCPNEYLKFARGDLKITMKNNLLTIDIERVPIMTGQPSKSGKITAQSKKEGSHTAVSGLIGVFRVAGRVQNGLLQFVFTGEYTNAQTKKPLCSQAWNISGTRKDDDKAPPKK